VALNFFTTWRVSCVGHYNRMDELAPFELRGDKCTIVQQFLVDEFNLSTVFHCLDRFFVGHACGSSAEIQSAYPTPSQLAFLVAYADGHRRP